MVARPRRERSATRRFIKGGNRLDSSPTEPWPDEDTWTIQAVARLLGKKPKTIYNTLWENAARLSRPKYAQLQRTPGDLRFYRLLSPADVVVIRQCFRVRVK